jgi:hypothetical protein
MGEFKKKPNFDALRGIPAYIKMVENAINTLIKIQNPKKVQLQQYPRQKDPPTRRQTNK